jgi:hypothetical protein
VFSVAAQPHNTSLQPHVRSFVILVSSVLSAAPPPTFYRAARSRDTGGVTQQHDLKFFVWPCGLVNSGPAAQGLCFVPM